MAKFKAGDFVHNSENEVWMIERVFVEDNQYSFNKGKEMYGLDNGVTCGFYQARAETMDTHFQLCD